MGKGPSEGPQIKWNKENVCESAGCLSKQELGGVLRWPLRARTSQSPSAKQQQTQQLTVGHRRLLLAYACMNTHRPPLSWMFHLQEQDGKALRKWQREKGRYDLSGMWQCFTVREQTCFVTSDTTTGTWEGLANSSLIPTSEQELNCLHYDTYCAGKVRFIRPWLITRTCYYAYVNTGRHKGVRLDFLFLLPFVYFK